MNYFLNDTIIKSLGIDNGYLLAFVGGILFILTFMVLQIIGTFHHYKKYNFYRIWIGNEFRFNLVISLLITAGILGILCSPKPRFLSIIGLGISIIATISFCYFFSISFNKMFVKKRGIIWDNFLKEHLQYDKKRKKYILVHPSYRKYGSDIFHYLVKTYDWEKYDIDLLKQKIETKKMKGE